MQLTKDLPADHTPLQFYKVHPDAIAPFWGSQNSACFDLSACLIPNTLIKTFRVDNVEVPDRHVSFDGVGIAQGERMLIPTGLIFDIPLGYSIRLHSRSGLSLKQGLGLANHEGVIDSDYIEPTYIMLHNASTQSLTIKHGDRIAQGEMIVDIAYVVEETMTKPEAKTNRVGGFGSTGV